MKGTIALAIKDIRLLLRDKAGFFFTFFFPLILAIFFGTIFSGIGEKQHALPIIVVDEDKTKISKAFLSTLKSAPELEVQEASRQKAAKEVLHGQCMAYVVMKPGFGEAFERLFWGDPPTMELGIDPARQTEAGMLQGILTKYAARRFQNFFSHRQAQLENIEKARESLRQSSEFSKERKQVFERFFDELELFLSEGTPKEEDGPRTSYGASFEPLSIEKIDVALMKRGPTNAYEVSFPQGIIWGILGCTAAFGISLVAERNKGTLQRLLMSPLSLMQILAGKALACFMTIISLSIALLAFAMIVFSLQPYSFLNLAFAIVSLSFSFVGIMMFLSVLGRTERSATGIGWALLLMMAMFGGGMIPLFFMPGWLQGISHFSPVKWAILAMEGAIWRQFSLQEMLLPCGILISVGLASFVFGVIAFHWSERR